MFPSNAYDWALVDYLKHINDYRQWLDKVSKQASVPSGLIREISEDLDELERLVGKNTKKRLSKRVRKSAADKIFWIDMKVISMLIVMNKKKIRL